MESRHPLVAACLAMVTAFGVLGCGDKSPVETPVTPPFAARSEDEVLAALQDAYVRQDFDLFAELIATESGAVYEFHFPDPLPNGATSWDAVEELRIHRRLWQPGNTLPGEPPGSPCLWHIIPLIVRESPSWTERTELYRSASNPQGLDRERWRATGAAAQSECFVETLTDTDYRIQSRSEFVVIEDRAKPLGAERKFLLFRWLDLDGAWERVKVMCP